MCHAAFPKINILVICLAIPTCRANFTETFRYTHIFKTPRNNTELVPKAINILQVLVKFQKFNLGIFNEGRLSYPRRTSYSICICNIYLQIQCTSFRLIIITIETTVTRFASKSCLWPGQTNQSLDSRTGVCVNMCLWLSVSVSVCV